MVLLLPRTSLYLSILQKVPVILKISLRYSFRTCLTDPPPRHVDSKSNQLSFTITVASLAAVKGGPRHSAAHYSSPSIGLRVCQNSRVMSTVRVDK